MYYVYIIYSLKLDRYYIGSNSNLDIRLKKHNSNHKGFTGKTNDWLLKYSESFELKSLCLEREKQLKNWKNRNRIEELISKTPNQ